MKVVAALWGKPSDEHINKSANRPENLARAQTGPVRNVAWQLSNAPGATNLNFY